MPEPIVVRFTLTADRLAEALRLHARLDRGLGSRAWMFGCQLVAFVSVVYLFRDFRLDGSALFTGPLAALGVASFLFILFLKTDHWNRWMAAVFLRNQPESARDVEWTFSDDQIEQRTSLATSSMIWDLVTKVVEAPSGFLICQGRFLSHWIPADAFESPEEIRRFAALAGSRAKEYVLASECRAAERHPADGPARP